MGRDTGLKQMRDKCLYEVYKEGLVEIGFTSLEMAINYARKHPAPSYFITARTASLYLRKRLRGEEIPGLHRTLQRKVDDILTLYLDYLAENPDTALSREGICEQIVDEEAPEFYIGYDAARKIILRERRLERERMISRWR